MSIDNKDFDWITRLSAAPKFPLFARFLSAVRGSLSAIIIGPDYVVMDRTSYEKLQSDAEWTNLPRIFAPSHADCFDESAEIPETVFNELNPPPSPRLQSDRQCSCLSERGKEWQLFNDFMIDHIENYTIPQYGDKPDDQISSWTVEQVMVAIRKRTHRAGKNSRGPAEDLRDCLKMAHEACVAYFKVKAAKFIEDALAGGGARAIEDIKEGQS